MLNLIIILLAMALVFLIMAGLLAVHVLLWLIPVLIYFLPVIIAWKRKHPNTVAIFLLDLFLGWTALGWLALLAWSILAKVDRSQAVPA